jgi:cytochrome c556
MRIGTISGLILGTTGATFGVATALSASPAAVTISADQAVAERQAAFRMSAVTFGAVKAMAESGGDPTKAAFPASGLAAWAKALPGAFPAGSDVPPTEALPTVWSDAAGFARAAGAYQVATGKLVAAAKAGDAAGLKAAVDETGKACGTCHDSYRKQKPK